MITIDIAKQTLTFDGKTYSVSTAKRGVGEKNGSLCTPRGQHVVRAKIGTGQPLVRSEKNSPGDAREHA